MPCYEAPDVILYRIGWTFVDSDRGLLLCDRFSQSIRERLNSWTLPNYLEITKAL